MRKNGPAVFKGRHFQEEVILLCVCWYLRYSLSFRDLEKMMTERGLSVDHSTIARWVLRYAPLLQTRMRRHLRHPNRSWRVDETYVRVAGRWTYLYRAVDSEGNTIEQDHRFIKKRIMASQWFRSIEGALHTIQGYEAMHMLRKGQIRWVKRGDIIGQVRFVNQVFGLTA
ncbi:MAG TPA: IS6 family transposase [Bryobacteraceae bacterium]|nr:IS6 family transposase [Bryobacteraceae bacterium]